MILQQNSTHKAIKQNGRIEIFIKGFTIPADKSIPGDKGYSCKDEYLYSIPLENKDDLFSIFERLDEDNRCNIAEANAAFKNL